MRITALVTGRGREPGRVVPLPISPEPAEDAAGTSASPDAGSAAPVVAPLQLAMERRYRALLATYPDWIGVNTSVRDAHPRSAVEWVLELMREQDLGTVPTDLQWIGLAHSTLDANVFHAPAARIKHALGARRALPIAVGQCQSLAFFHALQLLSAWAEQVGSSSALIASVEKRRAPLPSHVSRYIPISDGVAAAVLRFDDGPGLAVETVDIVGPLLATESQGFERVIDEGDEAHARELARHLWRHLQPAPDVLCVGPNLHGGLLAQVTRELTRLSGGRALAVDPGARFFMASDPLIALADAQQLNRDHLPLLLWTVDDRLSVACARFTGRIEQAEAP